MSSELDKRVEEFFRNYQDRGMKKWAGFYLSDHTAKINQEQRRRDTVYVKKKPMSQKDIRAMLMQHRKVSVQLKELSVDSDVKADIVGFVEGYQEDTAIISRNLVLIEDINHIEFIE
jgi:hypothetical protein